MKSNVYILSLILIILVIITVINVQSRISHAIIDDYYIRELEYKNPILNDYVKTQKKVWI